MEMCLFLSVHFLEAESASRHLSYRVKPDVASPRYSKSALAYDKLASKVIKLQAYEREFPHAPLREQKSNWDACLLYRMPCQMATVVSDFCITNSHPNRDCHCHRRARDGRLSKQLSPTSCLQSLDRRQQR